MFSIRCACAFLILFLLPITWVAAGQDSLPPLPNGAQVRIAATPKTATVGDPIRIDLEISIPSGGTIEIPKPKNETGDFSILEFFPGPTVPDTEAGSNKRVPLRTSLHPHRARIVLAVYRTGIFYFPPVPIHFRGADGNRVTFPSPSAKIEIRSVLSDKSKNLIDLKKQAEMQDPVRWWLWLAGVAAAIMLFALGRFLLKRRRRTAAPVPATAPQDLLDSAESQLQELLSRKLPEKGMVKEFYILISDIVKKILGAGYGIHTAERTTSEIMSLLSPRLERSEEVLLVESFLLRCDFVKFAKYVPGQNEHESTAKDSLLILEKSRKFAMSTSKTEPEAGSHGATIDKGGRVSDC